MPTDRAREYYALGFSDGYKAGKGRAEVERLGRKMGIGSIRSSKPKRKLSAWQKFVKVQSKRPMYKKMNNTRRLKAIGVAWRKTPAGKKRR